MLIFQLKNNLTKPKSSFDLLVSFNYHFQLMFYHQLWVKWVCMHIENSSEHIEQSHSRFPKCLWMFDTE